MVADVSNLVAAARQEDEALSKFVACGGVISGGETSFGNAYEFNNPGCFPRILTDGEDEPAPIDALTVTSNALDVIFISVSGYLVFLMQCGFAMLTAGSVRTKNTKNVLLKNFLDACVGSLAYYLFGWAFAYGEASNSFIGHSNFALAGLGGDQYHSWFFQWTFAATAATIVSGSVAERTSFYAYLGYAFFLTGFVYPVVSHWVWGGGWASDLGVIDFAGCSVVHMVGGFAGLMGAAIVGPRLGRFDSEGKVVPMPGHSATLATLGTFILWFGWYGFNPGSTLGAGGDVITSAADLVGPDAVAQVLDDQFIVFNSSLTIQRCIVTTTLAAGSAGTMTLILIKIKDHIYDLIASLNGALAGLVGITASCAFVEPYAAIIIGIIAAVFYVGSAWLLLKLRIDDPLEAFPIHGVCGIWGALAVGLFNRRYAQAEAGFDVDYWGAFYGGGGRLFANQLAIVAAVIAWTCALIGVFFAVMKILGLLRVSEEEELLGNDVSKHGGSAYPEDVLTTAEAGAQAELKNYQKDNLGVDESLKPSVAVDSE
eukprot:CAMPEP_0198365446 /NCGR_PEP_ID=MMETSP1450-20131203/154176_1 /TAXON_ID=753684 ORGANISM="Madagascaria erythrocladiodes, Strain CCMP3234" /NCGR_SAMPLE_ID=MMETSP1450 /ASSEMBLY_ACC=CAM_ASM_001115 /LENGTH=540 /DNA_ID=CAMNT_0044072897 /DNA_START=131 /DNA_END=1753 /DNA_ORIENTATION=+